MVLTNEQIVAYRQLANDAVTSCPLNT